MILILTCSFDQTTDLMIRLLQDVPVFRFNIDLWNSYSWVIDGSGYELRDCLGRECHESQVGAVYLRKLIFDPARIDVPAGGSEEDWCRHELLQVWEGIRDLAHETGKLAVIQPSLTGGWNKMRQMRVATRFFNVPDWRVHQGTGTCTFTKPTVVKTLGATAVGDGGLVMVKRVVHTSLNPGFPWFVQELLESATHDVTVAHVRGRNFAFEVSRDSFDGEDCRMPTFHGTASWTRTNLSQEECKTITAFMMITGYTFGRLDFLRVKGGLWFLEVNPNGQFAWLDPQGSEGLLQAVADEILSTHAKNEKLIPS
jgi:hypothetical protein